MAAYLKAFKFPEDYQEKMLALSDDTQSDMQPEKTMESETTTIKTRLSRLYEPYPWGDIISSARVWTT